MLENDLKSAANLCKIDLSGPDSKNLLEDMKTIFNEISLPDAKEQESTRSDYSGVSLHDDEPGQVLDKDAVLKNAPANEDGFIVVPRENIEDGSEG